MNDSAKQTFSIGPIMKCVEVLLEQAYYTIAEHDFEAAAAMLEDAGSLCWILQKRVTA